MLDAKELYDEYEELKSDREMYDESTDESMPLTDYQRYQQLKALDEQIDLLYCWHSSKNLIEDFEFADHVKDMMTEIYTLDTNSVWYQYIDWKEWADDERSNYDELEFDGATYLWMV
jgi:hypothetical protein